MILASAFVGANFCFSTGSLRVQSEGTVKETASTQLGGSLCHLCLERIEIRKILALWKSIKSAPTNAVTETNPKLHSPTVRAVARRSIMLSDSEGYQIEQTRLRPISRGKSKQREKRKTVSYEGSGILKGENIGFSLESCSLLPFCHDRQKGRMPRNCSIRSAVQSGTFKDSRGRLSLQG